MFNDHYHHLLFLICLNVQVNNEADQLLRTVDSFCDSLRRSLENGSNISNKPFVKENIAVQVKRVTDRKKIRFPDNLSTTGTGDWFANTESHLTISSDAVSG